MNRIAKFEKISLKQFIFDMESEGFSDEEKIENIYNQIQMPNRATKFSAGYDFYLPFPLQLKPGEGFRVPTGIRCRINENYVLQIYPRSSLGFKYRLQLDNTVGIIDADYCNAKNEGHIMIVIRNNSKDNVLQLEQASAFCQGLFVQYGITEDDECEIERIGGFGSTSKS